MTFSHHALIARAGNEPGARDDFARLVAALAQLRIPGIRRIRENPGDWGIDAFAGYLDDDAQVWQSKFFIKDVGNGQQRQVRESFDQAVSAAKKHGYRLASWTLAIPISMDGPETKWWDGWKKRMEKQHAVPIELWDETALDALLRSPDASEVRDEFFPAFERAQPATRAVRPVPPDISFEDMLFIAQLREANVSELDSAREQFFNAELLTRDVHDKSVEHEVEALHNVRSEARSIWELEYNDSCAKEAGAKLPALHGNVMRTIHEAHLAQPSPPLRMHVIHRWGVMHQVVEDAQAGWVREWRDVARRHID